MTWEAIGKVPVRKIIHILINTKNVTQEDFEDLLGLSRGTISPYLTNLIELNFIYETRKLPNNTKYYNINEKGLEEFYQEYVSLFGIQDQLTNKNKKMDQNV